jgi:hypothetical protein
VAVRVTRRVVDHRNASARRAGSVARVGPPAAHRSAGDWPVSAWVRRLATCSVEDLERVVHRILAVPDCVRLLGVRGARERTYATAAALATEAALADLVARGTGTATSAVVPSQFVEGAIAGAEHVLGRPLTSGQTKAVRGYLR